MLNNEFNFTLDPCATNTNHKCENFFTKDDNGLTQSWAGHCVFCNSPYSKIAEWVKKCYDENIQNNINVVMLIPARTDTKYFHSYIYHKSEIRFIQGRLHFNNSKNSAPFPSMIVVFNKREV